MSVPQNFEKLDGQWSGTNRLHLPWLKENPAQESVTQATVGFAAKRKFLKIEYDWIFESERQDGLLLISREMDSEMVSAVWIDSWHNSDKYMPLKGSIKNASAIALKGFYAVPDHPEWGWLISLEMDDENSFRIVMHNVMPEGVEILAVETFYRRA